MKKLDDLICKINFRKATSIYIIFTLAIFIILFSILLFLFKDKIKLASDYEEANDIFERYGVSSGLKNQLYKLTRDSTDIVNVIILNKNNYVLYKANNKILDGKNMIKFNPYLNNSKYLQDNLNKNIIYKIVHPRDILFNIDYFRNRNKLEIDIEDNFSYEKYFEFKSIYLINCMADFHSGDKILIFRDVKPIPYANKIVFIFMAYIGLIFILYWVGLALWVYKDSKRGNFNSSLWGLLTLLTNLVGLLSYIIFKQNLKTCFNCGLMQNKDNIYCINCGSKINETCDKCGNIIKIKDKYCSRCGNKL